MGSWLADLSVKSAKLLNYSGDNLRGHVAGSVCRTNGWLLGLRQGVEIESFVKSVLWLKWCSCSGLGVCVWWFLPNFHCFPSGIV